MSRTIYTDDAPGAIGPYSPAIRTGNMLFIPGQILFKNLDDFDTFNSVYGRFFPENPPARECVEVSELPKGAYWSKFQRSAYPNPWQHIT